MSKRRQRRDAYIRLRWKILRDSPVYGGKFTSHQILGEPDRPALFSHWFDFIFSRLDGRTIWNAEIITATQAFWDEVDAIAWDRAVALLTESEQQEEFRLDFEPVSHRGQTTYRMRHRKPRSYEAFGGLTFREYEERIMADIIETEPPTIHENFRMDQTYRHGIGLKLVDATQIDRAVVEAAIDAFRSTSEADWTNAIPVPRERLPFYTENTALAALQDHDISPSSWPEA